MSKLENKLKKIINTFNNINREDAYKEIKKLSEKYNKNINVQNVLFQISQKINDTKTSIIALKKILLVEKNNIFYLSQLYKLLLSIGLSDEALKNIDIILKIEKKNYEALRDKSYIYFLRKNYIEAKKI